MTAKHWSQLAPTNSPITRSSGCTWTTVANGISAITAGRHNPSPDTVHAEVRRSEETDPNTPGWSIPDAVLAAKRLGHALINYSGDGWSGVLTALHSRHYVVIQGDSDQFGNWTCSGVFNGDHCIGIDGSRSRIVDGEGWHWIDDPICPEGRWERDIVIRRYAEKLNHGIRFAVFATTIPTPPPPGPTLRYGGKALPKPTVKVFDVDNANVRARPTTAAKVLNVRHRGGKWTAWQVTTTGEHVAGSSKWFGNKTGLRWIHESVVR